MCRASKCLLVAMLLLSLALCPQAMATPSNPFARAAAAYVVQVDGQTRLAGGEQRRLSPASLTKVMTAMVVLDQGGVERTVTISERAAKETGSRLRFKTGERYSVQSLLAAMLLESANDAAVALAEAYGTDEYGFARLMNAKARELGMNNSHFVNPNGHDHPQHYSSAADLAVLAEATLRNPVFRHLVSVRQMSIAELSGKRHFRLQNTNAMLRLYPGSIGGKTGYTGNAGKCLITVARRGNREVLLVLLNAPDRWNVARRMLDKGFALRSIG